MTMIKTLLRGTAPLLAAAYLTGLQPARMAAADFSLANDQVTFVCHTKGGMLWPDFLHDKNTGQVVKLGPSCSVCC